MEAETLSLVELEPKYETAFWEYLEALKAAGDAERWLFEYKGETYADMVEKLKCWKTGSRLPDGWVPASSLFLFRDGKFIGRVSLRHELNDFLRTYGGHIGYYIRAEHRGKGYGTQILRMALDYARGLGLERVLITCEDQGNPASARIIEKNGVDMAVEVFEKFSKSNPELTFFQEAVMNIIGYQYMQSFDIDAAAKLFKMNTEAYPNSANVWDSYAEACEARGDSALVVSCLKKALEILPNDTAITDQFRQLIQTHAEQVLRDYGELD